MNELNDNVKVELELSTISTLIAGLYCLYTNTDPVAIPASLYLELAEKIAPYFEKWDYEVISFEDWIKYNLLIIPKVMVEDELESLKENDLYLSS